MGDLFTSHLNESKENDRCSADSGGWLSNLAASLWDSAGELAGNAVENTVNLPAQFIVENLPELTAAVKAETLPSAGTDNGKDKTSLTDDKFASADSVAQIAARLTPVALPVPATGLLVGTAVASAVRNAIAGKLERTGEKSFKTETGSSIHLVESDEDPGADLFKKDPLALKAGDTKTTKTKSDADMPESIKKVLNSIGIKGDTSRFLKHMREKIERLEKTFERGPLLLSDGSRIAEDGSWIEFSDALEKKIETAREGKTRDIVHSYTDRSGNQIDILVRDGKIFRSNGKTEFEISDTRISRVGEDGTKWLVDRETAERIRTDKHGNRIFKLDAEGNRHIYLPDGKTATESNGEWIVVDKNNQILRKANRMEMIFIIRQGCRLHFLADDRTAQEALDQDSESTNWYINRKKEVAARLAGGKIFLAKPGEGFTLVYENLELLIKPDSKMFLKTGREEFIEISYEDLPEAFKDTGDPDKIGFVTRGGSINLGNGILAVPEDKVIQLNGTRIDLGNSEGPEVQDRSGDITSLNANREFVTKGVGSPSEVTSKFSTASGELETKGIIAAINETIFANGDRVDSKGNILFSNGDAITHDGSISFADGSFFDRNGTFMTPDGFTCSLEEAEANSAPGSYRHAEQLARTAISIAESVAAQASSGHIVSGDLAFLVHMLGEIAHLKTFVTEIGNLGAVNLLSKAEGFILEKLKAPQNPAHVRRAAF